MSDRPVNLKRYDSKNCVPTVETNTIYSVPRVTLSRRGFISLTSKAARIMDLKAGDRIVFLQDQSFPTDWYIAKSDDPSGFKLTAGGRKNLIAQSGELVGKIAASVNVPEFTYLSFLLACAGDNLYILDVKHPRVTYKTTRQSTGPAKGQGAV